MWDRAHFPTIEQYFVPEGKGWEIQRTGGWRNDSVLEVKISLSENGRAQILGLLIDGEPVEFDDIESENPYRD